MMLLRPYLALMLALLLAVTGAALAVARGAPTPAGQMVICTGTGPVMVYLDADGQPTEAPRYCPEAGLALLNAVATPVEATDAPQLRRPTRCEAPRPAGRRRSADCTQRQTHKRIPIQETVMSLKSAIAAAFAVAVMAAPALAGDTKITVGDPYARASNTMAGAAFMVLTNHGDEDDRLIGARSDIAQRVELHTHIENAEGVMRMVEVEDGFPIPAGEAHALKRGGDHVMFMGLNGPMVQDDKVTVTLTFEKAGDITVDIPVDLERKHSHGGHGTDG